MITGVREFKMLNAHGDEFNMMRNDAFFHAPKGLGWGETATVQAVGISYIVTDVQPRRPDPSGEMVFRRYTGYKEFLDFLQAGGLVLCYKPIDTWYYLDVIATIEKTEISHTNNHLVCPMTFAATSNWYEDLEVGRSALVEGKVYSYTYPYRYSTAALGAVDIANGNLSSYFRLSVFGPVQNPAWTLYQGNLQIAEGKVYATILAGQKLVVDTHPATMEIAVYTRENEYVRNAYGDSDFTTERLFALPPGPCRLAFSHEAAGVVDAFVEVRKRV